MKYDLIIRREDGKVCLADNWGIYTTRREAEATDDAEAMEVMGHRLLAAAKQRRLEKVA